MDNGPPRRVSYDQMTAIMDFMGQHVAFAMGALRHTEARHESKRLWGELSKILNGIRSGTKKTPSMWSRYWSDFKNKLKKKVKALNRIKRLGSSKQGYKPLTKLEKRALVILGPTFCKKYSQKHVLTEVKVEDSLDNGDFCEEPSESSDRVSDGDRDEQSEDSSPEENGEEPELLLTEPSLHNLYPKWLIDVEKKRADAELTRARAEEQRVSVASKQADASLAQAEALKKLSEAAALQADAIMRIAMFLETRGHSNPHLLPI